MKTIFILTCTLLFFSLVNIKDEDSGNTRAFYECSEPRQVNSSEFNLRKNLLYFQFDIDIAAKNLEQQNFLWLRDNPIDYFNGYLINTTKDTLTIDRQDGSLIMIQEALDEDGAWKPIEYWVYSGCGNSYFDPLKLPPNHLSYIPIKKHSGDFTTKIRLKLKNGQTIMYSDTFKGSIDKSQFLKETKDVYGILYDGPASYLDEN